MPRSRNTGWTLFWLTEPLMLFPAALLAPFGVLGGVILPEQILPLMTAPLVGGSILLFSLKRRIPLVLPLVVGSLVLILAVGETHRLRAVMGPPPPLDQFTTQLLVASAALIAALVLVRSVAAQPNLLAMNAAIEDFVVIDSLEGVVNSLDVVIRSIRDRMQAYRTGS